MFIISGWLPMYILIVRTLPHPVFCRLPYTNIAWEIWYEVLWGRHMGGVWQCQWPWNKITVTDNYSTSLQYKLAHVANSVYTLFLEYIVLLGYTFCHPSEWFSDLCFVRKITWKASSESRMQRALVLYISFQEPRFPILWSFILVMSWVLFLAECNAVVKPFPMNRHHFQEVYCSIISQTHVNI